MKVLVTGGAGFIGSHIVDLLVEKGHTVTALDDLSSGRRENVNPKAKFVKMDVNDPKLAELFTGERFDWVDHHAAQISVVVSTREPLADARVNIIGTLNVLEQSRKNGIKKFVFASSGGTIYGEVPLGAADEGTVFVPVSPYAVAKAAIEYYLNFYFHEYRLPFISLRYANIYGPRQDPFGEAGVVAIFTRAMLDGKTPTIFGDGKCARDFVFCKDVARANLMALETDKTGPYNIATGTATDVNRLYELLSAETGFKKPAKRGPARPGDLRRSILSPEKIGRELGWHASVKLSEGLKQTVEFFKK